LGVSIFFLYGLLFLFQLFLDYWLDVFILTDKRILDIEQKGLFQPHRPRTSPLPHARCHHRSERLLAHHD
jgi:hypothetical protein